jgi:predicted nucleic acid-binding protein
VTLIADTGPLYAHADRRDPDFAAVLETIDQEQGDIVVSAFAAAEVDDLLLRDFGVDVEASFVADLASGAFRLESLTRRELAEAHRQVLRYRDLELGLADASLVVLAGRFATTRLLTFDERHFRTVEPLQGGHFTLLPKDG